MVRKRTAAIGILTVITMAIGACGSPGSLEESSSDAASSQKITVGSANFSENVVLANIYAAALEDAGYETEVKPNIGSREVTFPALQDGSIDMIPEYAGSLLAYVDSSAEAYDTEEIVAALHQSLPEGFVILDPAEAENRDVKVVTSEFAAANNLVSITDLAPIADNVVFGGPPESVERRAGLQGIEEVYGITFGEFKPIDLGGPLTVAALVQGDVNVAQMYSTQPAIAQNNFVVLDDPLHISTAENVVPLIRENILTPELAEVVNSVTESLTTETLIELNTLVEVDKQDPQKVARQYVDSLK